MFLAERFQGNPAHLRQLRKGPEAWNQWRKDSLEEEPNLKGAPLSGANLKNSNLENASLQNASLEGANLFAANLTGARLARARLSGANLEEANFENANLQDANLQDATLLSSGYRSKGLKKTSFLKAELRGSVWHTADLSGADLRVRNPQHLWLDDTRIHLSRFRPGSADPWSTVRRAYSGPRLLFHLLFLLAFLVPYILKAGYWKGVNSVQETVATLQAVASENHFEAATRLRELDRRPGAWTALEAEWDAHGLDVEASRTALELAIKDQTLRGFLTGTSRALDQAGSLGRCLEPRQNCGSPQPVWRPLLGLHQTETHFLLQVVALVLLLYNLCRGVLTYYVSDLREAEERSGYSPYRRQYAWVYYLHYYFLQYIPVAGLTVAGFQIAEWLLLTDVVLPVG